MPNQQLKTRTRNWRVSPSVHCRAWRRITLLATVSWLLIPDGDPCGLRSDVSAMCHVKTALLVTDHSLPPVRVHGMSCRSVHVTLGYRWLLSMNVLRPTYSLPRSETTAHLWHLWFLCAAYKCTYLLTYWSVHFNFKERTVQTWLTSYGIQT